MPKVKDRGYPLTRELLQQYHEAALANARALLEEAALLLRYGHHARAYFLAVATIEETGKAVGAFDGIGRHLQDAAVATRLQKHFDDHAQKIRMAFLPWLQAKLQTGELSREELQRVVSLMIDLQYGREPAMYTDIHLDGPRVLMPSNMVRRVAAEDCVRLAGDVLAHARLYVAQTPPRVTTQAEDQFFALGTAWSKFGQTQDFWEYVLSRMQAGDMAIEHAAMQYHRDFFSKHAHFKPAHGPA